MHVESVGLKDESNKLRFDLITPEAIIGMAEILTYGAKKYKPNSWQNVPEGRDKHYAALMRHVIAWRSGELFDSETKLHHMKHILTNAMFILHHDENHKHGN